MSRFLKRATRGKVSNDTSAGLQTAADGVLRGPAARGLVADRMGGEDTSDATLQAWLEITSNNKPDTRQSIVRLAPMQENAGSLASFTPAELIKGFLEQDEETPPFVVKGQLAKNGRWAALNTAVSHIDGRTVTTIPCEPTLGLDATQQAVYEQVEKHINQVLQGEDVTVLAFGQVGSGKTYTMAGPAEVVDDFANIRKVAWGLIPRCMAALIKEASDFRKGGGAAVTFEASFVEVLCVGEVNKKGVWTGDEVFNDATMTVVLHERYVRSL